MKLFSHRKRPVHLGPYPLERLPRLADPATRPPRAAGVRPGERRRAGPRSAGHAYERYLGLFDRQRHGDIADAAPVPDDPVERAHNVKAGLYFLDADMVGCALVPADAWLTADSPAHRYAVVTLIAHTRTVGRDQPGDDWIDGTRQVNADLRAAELSVLTAGYIRRLGFEAVAHTPTSSDVDAERIALQCGLIESVGGRLRAPYLRGGFALSVVTTDFEMEADAPLARRGPLRSLGSTRSVGWLLGRGGTRAGLKRLNGDHRPLHLGRYPMEKIARVDEPTTLVIPDEIRRVPVRAGGFPRAAHGDMGPKFQNDVKVFAFKTPQAQTYVQQIGAMVPHQDGDVAPEVADDTTDPDRNADALKAPATATAS